VAPAVFLFVLFSRVRFFMRDGKPDAEYQEVGLYSNSYHHFPSMTPTSIRKQLKTRISIRQSFQRLIYDPALNLEPWEIFAQIVALGLLVQIYKSCVSTKVDHPNQMYKEKEA